MKPVRVFCLLLLLLTALGAAGRRTLSAEEWVRQGSGALSRADWASAIAAFEKAELYTTDPGLVAFNLATARYQQVLAGEGGPPLLREAELGYRCCLGKNDERRARALVGLGNCLLLRGTSELGPDLVALKEALATYDRALALPALPAALADTARQNRERVRLLLFQATKPSSEPDPMHGDDKQSPPEPPRSENGMEKGREPGGKAQPDPDGKEKPADRPGEPIETESAPPPGQGNLPPVPDTSDQAGLLPPDAEAHLEQAARRVLEERRVYRQGRASVPGKAARNW